MAPAPASNNPAPQAAPAPPQPWLPEGYPKLAHLLGRFPEATVLRRFGPLSMMTLLNLQAKLVALDIDLWRICSADQTPMGGNWTSLADIRAMSITNTGSHHTNVSPNRNQKLKEIQDTLKEYHEMLLLFAQVSELGQPRRDQVRFLQSWLQGDQEGNNFLKAAERFTWDDKYEFDFVVPLKSRTWIHPTIIEMFHWIKKPRKNKEPPNITYLDVEVGKLGRVEDFDAKASVRVWATIWRLLAVLIAAMLPVLAVLVLYHIPKTINRIGAAVGMTAFTAFFMRFFTSASVKEIFGATAAFAAIVVVFIGSANGKP